uniref:Protein FAR1-related sequence 5-like n=1 Tax=Tanacetum cinerariifolium TaxID=118510 RepID=A0A6L2KT60_TANCI|nr:protein FAR1-related sequence 5-like [Tanacetum cinerariifolium]
MNKNIIEEVTSKIPGDAVMEKVADLDTIIEEVTEGIPIPVEGAYYDTIDEALDMYTKYAEMAGFEIEKGGQMLTKSEAVQHKYIYCNKEGVPKGESDAQMLINKMENRKMYVPNFTFQCRVENSELVAMFWADEVAKCNYKEFGDIVSFDATFNSNKYNMKFVPFIGIDNHEKCVTLGSKMLLHEDTKSYMWLLNAFMTAFSHEPIMIVTDQDGAMKRAIESVFKTTSRSESENSFFKSFTTPGATLVSFMMSYESAMERQRYRQETLDFKTIDAALKCETKLEIERHAARVLRIIEDGSVVLDKGHNTSRPEKTKKQIWGKKLTIERLTNEANFLVDDSLFLLSKDNGKMGAYVEELKILFDEMKADMPNHPSRNTRDVIGGIFSITKSNQIAVQNPTKAINKEEHLKKGERLKSEREKSLNVGKKKLRVCGFCKEKTNEHTKTTCPLNPKAKKERRHQLLMFEHFLVT